MKDSGRFMKTIGRMTVAAAAATLLAAPAAAEEPPQVMWGKLLGTAGWDHGYKVTVDGEGNVIFCATMDGTLEGLGVGIASLTKYSPTGSLLWSQQLGTPRSAKALDVATDSAGNLYLGGETYGSLFEPSAGDRDLILAKYDSQGELVWGRQFGTAYSDRLRTVATDAADNIVVGGDRWLRTYDASGDLLWQREAVGGVFALDAVGDIYVAEEDHEYAPRGIDLAKYSGSGSEVWVRRLTAPLSGAADVDVRSVAVSRAGDVYIAGHAGYYSDTAIAWLIKCDAEGSFLWLRKYGVPGSIWWNSVTVDSAGNAYVGGGSQYDYNPTDMEAAKYDGQGNLLWILGDPLGGRSSSASGVALDTTGGFYITGKTARLFGLPGAGEGDAFVAKFRPACYADCDGSGSTDFFDFLCFQNLFTAGDVRADCDGSEVLDFLDFLCFQNAFAAGCPE